MTEYSSVVFVFFFLGEYGAILLICLQLAIFFCGGYLLSFTPSWEGKDLFLTFLEGSSTHLISGLFSALALGVKALFFIILFIIVRASLPRIRFDQLMVSCWIDILPFLFAFVIFLPSFLSAFNSLPPFNGGV